MADLVVPAAIRALRAVVKKGLSVVKERLPQGAYEVEPVLVRNPQRLNPVARIRNQQAASKLSSNRAYQQSASPYARYYTTTTNTTRQSPSPLKSAIGKHSTVSPFASTLRPKLCGALPRSAGGYTLGGGSARYFSHTPAAPADVIAQVSQAMRAFILSGKDVRYNQRRQPNNYVRGQIKAQLAAASTTDRHAPGAYVDFHMTPSLSSVAADEPVGTTCLDDARGGFLDALNDDLQESIRDISAVFQDLRRLSSLGALPITLVAPHTLRVHFRGCDAEIVTRLCDEVGVMRGIIHEDERFAFDRIIAEEGRGNVDWQEMMSSEDGSEWSGSMFSQHDLDEILADVINESAWQSEMDGDYDEIDAGGEASSSEGYGSRNAMSHVPAIPLDVGILLAECDGYKNPWIAVGKA